MKLTVFSGSANRDLARTVAEKLEVGLGALELERFPDGELHVRLLQSVRGQDLFLIQPTGPPVESNLFELLMITDACRRAGASRVTAVMPYFGYARQDRRASGRESIGARLAADVIRAGGLDRAVALDLHNAALEGFFSVPIDHLSAVPLLAESLRRWRDNTVVVAPDLGAAKIADRYAKLLDLPVAIVHKTRVSGRDVTTHGVTGDVQGRTPLIVDDMISTGATIEAASVALAKEGSLPVAAVAATHGLFTDGAEQRLRKIGARSVIVTDSLAAPEGFGLPLEVVSIGPLLTRAIESLHHGRSLAALSVAG